jgi:hypothetical protein
MRKLAFILLNIILLSRVVNAQEVSFSFSANHSCTSTSLDSILIENLTQGYDTTIFFPDFIFSYQITNIDFLGLNRNKFFVYQNYPNPFESETSFDVFAPEPDRYSLNVYDITGRKIAQQSILLGYGLHSFTFYAGNSTNYFLSVMTEKSLQNIKMLRIGQAQNLSARITYNGISTNSRNAERSLKSLAIKPAFVFEYGDELKFTGYARGDFADIIDIPNKSKSYHFDISNQAPEVPSEVIGKNVVCENASNLEYEVIPIENVEYEWILPEDWQIIEGANSNRITVNAGTIEGEIRVKAKNSCGESDEQILSVSFSRPNPEASSNGPVCEGETIELSVNQGVSWEWTGPNGFKSDRQNLEIENSSADLAGEYTVSITDMYGCSAVSSVQIEINPLPIITISGEETICANETSTFTATGGISYLWNTGELTPSISVNSEGTYTVSVTNEHGCTLSEDKILTVNPVPTPSIIGDDNICIGGTTTLTANGGNSYLWNTGETTNQISVSSQGTFTVTAENEYGCRASESIYINVYQLPVSQVIKGGGGYCRGGEGVPIGLENSEDGLVYQLIRHGYNYGSPVIGNGGAISFGNAIDEGTYTAIAFNPETLCEVEMSGEVYVVVYHVPQQPLAYIESDSPRCYVVTMFRRGDVPSGQYWYWQTSDTGKSTEVRSDFYHAFESGLFYIRPLSVEGCWGYPTAAYLARVLIEGCPNP